MRADPGIPLTNAPAILPQISNHFSAFQSNETTEESRTKKRSARSDDSKGHALVVDDVPDVTDMLSVLLMHAGWEVVTAASATAALAAAREAQFDIVISDIGMPTMNGYELARTLRAQPGYENIPMVAVTGYSMFDDRERSLAAGFNAHLTKPIEPRVLLDLIDTLRN
ncbi:MAG TPA: response regulator [Pyrinomonadaceae bacterium]|nr:response regulator [Pyrinomonadaceae bacterium]